MMRFCKDDECNWTVVAMPVFILFFLVVSLYLIISGAENIYNFPLWPATVLSVLSCSSNCTSLCTQRFAINVSWIAQNATFEENNVTGGWQNKDELFCENLHPGTQFQVITPRDEQNKIIAIVPKDYDYDGGGLYTGILFLSVLVMGFCAGFVVVIGDCWKERRRNYSSI